MYPPPAGETDILGLEFAGEVVVAAAVTPGSTARSYAVGDRVMGLLSGGGNAQFVTVPAGHVMPIPDGIDHRSAAAIPETWLTAYQLLFLVGKATASDTVLIHAAGSGVGTAAVQLAHQAGLTVVAVAGSDDKVAAVTALGATHTINYK